MSRRLIAGCLIAAYAAALTAWSAIPPSGDRHDASPTRVRKAPAFVPARPSLAVRVWSFHYRAHDRVELPAYVVLPAWYRPAVDPPLPLVISPHGRGVDPRADVRLWGDLPAVGHFAVVAPAGEGLYSWGSAGQIDDLANMPRLLRRGLPWLRVEPHGIYAVGGSMGGQETLLLLARHPHLLAGAIAFDSVANFAYQYREFGFLRCNALCVHRWREPLGRALQTIARREIGGTPATDPRGYALRSPLDYAPQIARSKTPLELWWSTDDLIVRNQRLQSGQLFERIKHLNPRAPVEEFVGSWVHTAEMRSTSRLPLALAEVGLLPKRFDRLPHPLHYHPPKAVTGASQPFA